MSEYISQTKAILAYLRQGYGITSLEALNLFNCLNLKARMHEARRDGWGIRTTMIKTSTGKRVAWYTLTDPQQETPAGIPQRGRKQTGTFAGQLAALEREIEHMRAGKDWKEGARWVIEKMKNL